MGVEPFLCETDDVGEPAILRLLADVNDDANKISNLASGLYLYQAKPFTPENDSKATLSKNVHEVIGPVLLETLDRRMQNQDSVVVQLALQTLLLRLAQNVTENWLPPDIVATCEVLRANGKISQDKLHSISFECLQNRKPSLRDGDPSLASGTASANPNSSPTSAIPSSPS
jgi:hypothetical protein